MKQLSSFLKQENKEVFAYFWLGEGRNGKGTVIALLIMILGDYWGELSMDYYVNHTQGVDRPNQNLYNCRNARVLHSGEMNDENHAGKPVNIIASNFLKISGGDILNPRELGTKEVAIFRAGKPIIDLNSMPNFTKLNNAIKERILILNFPYTFINDEIKIASDPNKFKLRNSNIKAKFETDVYRIAGTNILFEWYKKYQQEYIVPPSVRKYTKSYFSTQTIEELLLLNCEYNPTKQGNVELETLKNLYNTEKSKKCTVNQIKEMINELGYEITKREVKNLRLKIEESEEQEENIEYMIDTY
jgi:hypothetical protein